MSDSRILRPTPSRRGRAAGAARAELNSAAHLLASATAFFFLAFVFALLLPPLAEQRRPLAAEGHRAVPRSGPSSWRSPGRARARPLSAWPTSARAAGRSGASRASRRSPSASRRSSSRWSNGRRGGFGPTDGGYASVFFGWTAFHCSSQSARCSGSRTSSPPPSAIGRRSTSGRPRVGRPRPALRTTSPTHSRSCARARGGHVLLVVPRRARRADLDRPLPPLRPVHVEPPLYAVLVAAVLYWLGGRRRVRVGSRRGHRILLGLLAIVAAVDTPLDTLADRLFSHTWRSTSC